MATRFLDSYDYAAMDFLENRDGTAEDDCLSCENLEACKAGRKPDGIYCPLSSVVDVFNPYLR